ncbi:unnamed protein product [Amoebophrya sp. A120]|nr:unnamed protein product [Amoebophrya sp. A120]|eukprot:GSA120T00006600001.1
MLGVAFVPTSLLYLLWRLAGSSSERKRGRSSGPVWSFSQYVRRHRRMIAAKKTRRDEKSRIVAEARGHGQPQHGAAGTSAQHSVETWLKKGISAVTSRIVGTSSSSSSRTKSSHVSIVNAKEAVAALPVHLERRALFGCNGDGMWSNVRVRGRKNKWRAWIGAETSQALLPPLRVLQHVQMPPSDKNTKTLMDAHEWREKTLAPTLAINYQKVLAQAVLERAGYYKDPTRKFQTAGAALDLSKLFFGRRPVVRQNSDFVNGTDRTVQAPSSDGWGSEWGGMSLAQADSITFETQEDLVTFAQTRLCHWTPGRFDSHGATSGTGSLGATGDFEKFDICVAPEWDVVSAGLKTDGRWRDCQDLPGKLRNSIEQRRAASGATNQKHANFYYLDVGGNLGSCIFEMLATSAELLAGLFVFEPHPVNVFRLTSTLSRLPPRLREKVVVFPIGLGAVTDQHYPIFSESGNMGNSILGGVSVAESSANTAGSRGLTIHADTIDEIFGRSATYANRKQLDNGGSVFSGGCPHGHSSGAPTPEKEGFVGLMKVDIQGFECNFLRGFLPSTADARTHWSVNILRVKAELDPAMLSRQGCAVPEYSRLFVQRGFCSVAHRDFSNFALDLDLRRGKCVSAKGLLSNNGLPCTCE